METIDVKDIKEVRKVRLQHKDKWVVYHHKGSYLKCYNTSIQIHDSPQGAHGSRWDLSVKDFNAVFEEHVFVEPESVDAEPAPVGVVEDRIRDLYQNTLHLAVGDAVGKYSYEWFLSNFELDTRIDNADYDLLRDANNDQKDGYYDAWQALEDSTTVNGLRIQQGEGGIWLIDDAARDAGLLTLQEEFPLNDVDCIREDLVCAMDLL